MKKIFLFGFAFLFFLSFKILASDVNNRVALNDNIGSIGEGHKNPLPGTEVVVSLINPENLESIANEATEMTGLPIFLVRKMDANHVVFAVDQDRLFEIMYSRLFDHGVTSIAVLPGEGPEIMGKKPIPKIQIELNQEETPDLWSAVVSAANSVGWEQQKEKYTLVSNQIVTIVRVPVNSYSGTEEEQVLIGPATEKYLEILTSLASASKGGSAEFIRLVK